VEKRQVKAGDRVFLVIKGVRSDVECEILFRIDDDSFAVLMDGRTIRLNADEVTPVTKLHKLLAGEENA